MHAFITAYLMRCRARSFDKVESIETTTIEQNRIEKVKKVGGKGGAHGDVWWVMFWKSPVLFAGGGDDDDDDDKLNEGH